MDTYLYESQSNKTTYHHKDLVQLSGYHAYSKIVIDDEIKIDGKVFLVEDLIKNPTTGFEAFVVRNTTPLNENGKENHDGELIIVYVGSRLEPSDWATNVDLLKDIEPEQMKQAKPYHYSITTSN